MELDRMLIATDHVIENWFFLFPFFGLVVVVLLYLEVDAL